MSVDSSGNQKVDFAWGNFPMQPNDDRDGSGALVVEAPNLDQNRGWSGTVVYPSQLLNQALDNHLLVSTGHNGYPDYLPGDVDAIPGDIPIPDLVGGNVEFATAQWEAAGFNASNIIVNYIPNAGGANPQNDGTVASQSPEAGHTAGVDHVITLNVYQYVEPYIAQTPVSIATYIAVNVGGGGKDWSVYLENYSCLYGTCVDYPTSFRNFFAATADPATWVGKKLVFTDTGTPMDNVELIIGPNSYSSGASPLSILLNISNYPEVFVNPNPINTGFITILS